MNWSGRWSGEGSQSSEARVGRRVRRSALLVLVALVAGVAGFGGQANASDGGRWKKVDISFGVEGYYDSPIVDQLCDSGAPTNCVAAVREDGFTLFGDLVGTGIEVRSVSVAPTNIAILRGVGTFAGTVKDCGTGTFIYTYSERFDVTTNTGNAVYTIAPGTGTGDLAGITGTFVAGSGPVRCRRR